MVGEVDDSRQLTDLILNSCEQSIFFSHRIWFFCQSLLFASSDEGTKHRKLAAELLKNLQKVVINGKELLCLVNSAELFQQITKYGLLQFYPFFNKSELEKDPNND